MGPAMPDVEYLEFVKRGTIGFERYGKGGAQSRFVGLDERWKAHYIEGFVTYPGLSRCSFVPVELTDRGEAANPGMIEGEFV